MDKGKSLKLLAIVLVVLNLANWASSLGRNRPLKCYEKPKKCVGLYVLIDERLKTVVPTDDVDENMKMIQKWITQRLDRDETMNFTRTELTEFNALTTVSALTQVDGIGQCKITTAIALQNNDEALRGALSKLDYDAKPKTRLGTMLKHYRDKFLEHCDFDQRLKAFDTRKLENIQKAIGELIGAHVKDNADSFNLFQSKIVYPESYVSDNPKNAANFAEKHLKSLGGSVDGEVGSRFLKFIFERNHMKPLQSFDEEHDIRPHLKEHLTEPCQDYITELDGLFTNNWTRAQSLKRNTKRLRLSEYYKYLAYFYGCHKVLLNRRDFSITTAAALASESKRMMNKQKNH